jgi:hypothetical protein
MWKLRCVFATDMICVLSNPYKRCRKRPPIQAPLFMEEPPRISELYISTFVSYFENDLVHNFTYVVSKGKKKMKIYGSGIRGGSSMKGGP